MHNIRHLNIVLLIVLLILAVDHAFAAAPPVVFTDTSKTLLIGRSLEILEDTGNSLSAEEIITSDKFIKSDQHVPNLGLSASAFWFRFQITNISDQEHIVLELSQPIMDEVEFYTPLPDGSFNVEKAGEYQHFSRRPYNDPSYIFDLHIPKNSTNTYLLKIRSKETIQVPVYVGPLRSIYNAIKTRDVLSGIYCGIMLCMLFYNLFIYFTVKDKSYLYYVVYILIVLLTQTTFQGYTFQYLWPATPWMAMHSTFLLPPLSAIASAEFMKVFINTKRYTPYFNKSLYLFYTAYAIVMSLFLLGYYAISFEFINMLAGILSFYMLFIAVIIAKKGSRPAQFFLLAWSVFLIGVFIYVLKDFEVLPYNTFTRYAMQMGSAVEGVLLSFALADRINILKKEKETAQDETLSALKENEKIMKDQELTLRKKVGERTSELRTSNKELRNTLKKLKAAQSQLVDAEKMVSLGQLTAGVAHEMNNPVNFIKANVSPLKRDIEDILQLLAKYGEITKDTDLCKKLLEIEHLKEELDVKYVIEEINSLLRGIDEGAFRTSEIVKSLRIFSHLDESELKTVNIHEGLDSTIALLINKIKKEDIELIKDYGEFPDIECYPGKLNQLFMNIINNAIDAISEKDIQGKGVITIKTSFAKKHVTISVKDNGIGMPESIVKKIFEPFFTTKEIGKGTGLGMSIAYGIVRDHKGTIHVESTQGEGSMFIIKLPVK